MNVVDYKNTRTENENCISKNRHYLHLKLDVYNKKNNNEIKLASDKTYTKQFNLCFIRKDSGLFFNATGLQADKKEPRGAKFNTTFLFLTTISFTVINIISYKLKTLKCSIIRSN